MAKSDDIKGDIELVSAAADGTPGDGVSDDAVFSPDGTKIAFDSKASNLVPGDTNKFDDVFVKDLTTGVVTRVSTAADGTQGNGISETPVFSPDGTKVAFYSNASNLVPGDTNGRSDIFVKDLTTGAVTRVSVDAGGAQLNGNSYNPVFSPDGTKIAFTTPASNLVPGDIDDPVNGYDVFVKDLATGTVTLVSTANGTPGNLVIGAPVFSADGSKIAFVSDQSQLVPGDTNRVADIFVKDLTTGDIERVSTDADGVEGNSTSAEPVFSPDGTKIAFQSQSANFVPGDINGAWDIFVKDLLTGDIQCVSTAADGTLGNGISEDPVLSPDGTKIGFWSKASNLVPGDTNGTYDFFVKDLTSGVITRVSTAADGTQGTVASSTSIFSPDAPPAFSPDGTQIAFQSYDDNLVPGDTNNTADIFVKTLVQKPNTVADKYVANWTTPLKIDAAHGLLANDVGENDLPLTVKSFSHAEHGLVTTYTDGSFTYTPDGTFVGFDTFTYEATDGLITSPDTPVTLTVYGNITLADTTADGSQVYYGTDFGAISASADGTKIVFSSNSGDLVGGGHTDYQQVYLKDLTTGAVTSVTHSLGGNSFASAISADGTKVAYTTDANNLQVVVKDLTTGVETVVSSGAGGQPGNGYSSSPVFSPDGTKLTFTSTSSNLVPGDTTGTSDIFVADLTTGALTMVDTAADGTPSNGFSYGNSVFSPDGTKVAFISSGTNLVPGGSTGLFVKDLKTGAITLVSTTSGGTPLNSANAPAFSPDGTKIAFGSYAKDLGGSGMIEDVFVKDLTTGALSMVDTAADGTIAHALGRGAAAAAPVFSPDGSEIAFGSQADNLVPGAANPSGAVYVYVKNLITGAIRNVSSDSFGAGGGYQSSQIPVFLSDSKIAFFSRADNFVPGDTNRAGDIFVKDLASVPLGSGLNTAPVAQNDSYAVLENTTLRVGGPAILANDTDKQHDALSAVLSQGPKHGALSLGSDGSFVYMPNADYLGTDSFTYWASDGTDTSARATVSLTVAAPPPGSGIAVDGYIVGGTVAYVDGSGPTTTTDAQGRFSLTGGSGPIEITGGTDSATGLAFTGTFEAPNGSSVLSPLTTLVEKVAERNGHDVAAANAAVVATFVGTGGAVNLLTLDPEAGTLAGDPVATAAFEAGAFLQILTTLVAKAGGSADAVFNVFGDYIEAGNPPFEFGNKDAIATLISNPAIGLPEAAVGAISTIVGDTSAALGAQLQGGGSAYDTFIAATGASLAAQGSATDGLADDPAGTAAAYARDLTTILAAADQTATQNTPCYCRGTRILTARGQVPVEHLAIGDLVVTASGGLRPITWLGHRRIDITRHPDPKAVWPICVSQGAFEENKPSRDLWLSPGHNIAAEGVLMPASLLVNGVSVVQHERSHVEYWHVELDRHDIILSRDS